MPKVTNFKRLPAILKMLSIEKKTETKWNNFDRNVLKQEDNYFYDDVILATY